MAAMRFLHQHNHWGVHPLPSFMALPLSVLPMIFNLKLDSQCPTQSLRLLFYAEALHLKPRSHREENQTLNICLNPETKTKYCVTFLQVTCFKQQNCDLHSTRKPLEWATCFAILSVGYCGTTTDLRF